MAENEVKSSKGVRRHCPHLGLSIDRTVMLLEATPAHRCFAKATAFAPETDYQQQYCLATNHIQCPFYTEPVAQERPLAPLVNGSLLEHTTQPRLASLSSGLSSTKLNPRQWLPILTVGTLGIALILALFTFLPNLLGLRAADNSASVQEIAESQEAETPPVAVGAAITETSAATSSSVTSTVQSGLILLPTPTPTSVSNESGQFVTPTPEPGGAVFYLSPSNGDVGWWSSADQRRSHLDDSFLYAGTIQTDTYVSAIRFDLRRVPRGATIRQLELRLTGLRQDRLAPGSTAIWWAELVPEKELALLGGSNFMSIFSAPSSITLPPVGTSELANGIVNVWEMDELTRAWLMQQLLDGAQSMIVRIKAVAEGNNTLFAWDSGLGPESAGNSPGLLISVGPPPATPPPTPTREVIVATFTPVPDLLEVVARNATATEVARTTGTYTPPPPIAVVTPTPFPQNLETVQAAAIANNLPAVVPDTPVPANLETATYVAAIATAVAQTTGTYTPVPTGHVTPILILPSPPPENVITVVARETEAAAAALVATPTPFPFNAVIAQYVIATVTPVNVLTAAVSAAQATVNAQTTGTPIPTPWNQVVLLPTPLPVTPPPTPTELLERFDPSLATATATALPPMETIPPELIGKILFRTNRRGPTELFAADLATNSLIIVNDDRVYGLAEPKLPFSPDGQSVAIVEADPNRLLQIKIRSLEFGTVRQLTAFGPNPQNETPTSYDPAWSPRGDPILFVSTNTGNDEIWTVNVEGNILTQLTFNRTEWDKHPSWSPDGSQIVFYSNRDVGVRRLWIMNADGSGQREISSLLQAPNSEYEDWDPIWVR